MGTPEDIAALLAGYTEMATNLGVMITNLDANLAAMTAEVATLESLRTTAQASLDDRLEAKRVANGWQSILTSYTTTSLESWGIYGYDENPITGPGNFNRDSDHQFSFTGLPSAVPSFINGTKVKCQAGSIERTITSVSVRGYQPGPDPPFQTAKVTVGLDNTEPALPNPLLTVERCELKYAYNGVGWDNDTGIINDIDAFAAAYKQINDPIDLATGTYGILAKQSGIQTGRDVQALNKTFYDNIVALYAAYAA
jgi:hypothetical protein